MKKNYLITIIICLLAVGITAQPVITYSGNAPQIGDAYEFSGDNGSYDPGPSGANQTWDFSGITPSFFNSTTAVAPGSTPFADEFSEANIAFHNTGDNETYSYAEVNTSEMLNDGVGFDPGGDNEFFIHYTDAVKLMKYPFSFNDTYTDSYFSAYTAAEGLLTHERGNLTETADAWGSVTTPAGTYNNCLRIKRERVYTDSVWMSGIFLYANTYTQTDYEWYTATSHSSVISISVTGDGSSASYRTNGVGIGEERTNLPQINIYPNPASDQINVEFPQEKPGNTEVYIYNLLGKQVARFEKTGSDLFSADISGLVPGVYFLRTKSSPEEYVSARFIKR